MILKNNRTIYIIEGLFLIVILLVAGILLYAGPVSVKKNFVFHSELLLKITKINKDIDLVKSWVAKSIYYGALKPSPHQKTLFKKALNNLKLNLAKTDKQYKELDGFIKKNGAFFKHNRKIILYFNKSYFLWKNISSPILKIIIKHPKYISSRISYKLFLKDTLYLSHLSASNIIKNTKSDFERVINTVIYLFVAATLIIISILILFFYYFNRFQKALLKEEQKFESMFKEQQSIGLVIDVENGDIINANDAAVSFYGYSRDELLKMNISRINVFTPVEEQKKFRRIAAEKRGNYAIFKHRLKNGDIKTVDARISKFISRDKPYLLGIINDITQEKALEEELNISHFYDPLTKLPNKNLFIISSNQHLNSRMYKEEGLIASLVIIDFYKLSYFNNTYGYDTGDKLLRSFSKRLSEAMREGDIIARTGEDEFGILFVELQNKEDILQIINRIKEEFKNPLHVEERPASESAIENLGGGAADAKKAVPEPFNVSFTMGISIFPDDGKNAEDLLKSASIALLSAKEQGEGEYEFFKEPMNVQASEFLVMKNSMINAFKNKEFLIYYQPYFDIKTGKIKGMEALARWNNKDAGIIPPVKFIPLIEKMGFIRQFEEFLIDNICGRLKEWKERGFNIVPVSMNISPASFKKEGLIEMIVSALDRYGIAPSLLTIEITEGLFIKNLDYAVKILNIFKEKGIKISLDDFGTGYSSLSYIKNIPADFIKIDISFVRGMMENFKDSAIVNTVVVLASNLGMKTISEGVETEGQLKILKSFGCDIVQGYLFSKPVPENEILEFLKA